MATRELTIRVTAEQAGVSEVFNRLQKEIKDISNPAYLSVDFHDAQVAEQVKALKAKAQREADKDKLRLEAEVIAREAYTQVFGTQRGRLPLAGPREVSIDDIEAAGVAGEVAAAKKAAKETEAILARSHRQQKESASRAGREAGEAQGRTWLESLKRTLGGRSDLKDIVELFRGAGPVAGIALAGRALNDMSSAAVEIKNDLNSGAMSLGEASEKIMATLPIFGQYWQAGRNIRELFTGENAAEAKALAAQTQRLGEAQRARGAMAQLRLSPQEIRDANLKAYQEVSMSGKTDRESRRLEDLYAKQAEAREITDKFDKLLPSLAPQDRWRVEEQKLQQLEALERRYAARRASAEAQDFKDQLELDRQSQKEMVRSDAEALQARLEMHGQYHQAEIEGIKAAAQEQMIVLAQQRREEQRDLAKSDPRFKDAQIRYDIAADATKRKMDLDIAASEQKYRQDQQDAERKHAMEIGQIRTKAAADYLRAAGQDLAAQKLQAQQAFRDRIAEIQQQYREELRTHAEQEPELRRRASEQAKAALAAYRGDIVGLGAGNITRTNGLAQSQSGGIFTGVAEQSRSRRTDDPAIKLLNDNAREAKRTADNLDKLVGILEGRIGRGEKIL
jgi:hypothetical protein